MTIPSDSILPNSTLEQFLADARYGDNFMNDFPLCKHLGLEVCKSNIHCYEYSINAEEIEALLARGVRVWLCEGALKTAHLAQPVDATSVGTLIDIQPVRKESAEDVLRDILAGGSTGEALLERARRVLDDKTK